MINVERRRELEYNQFAAIIVKTESDKSTRRMLNLRGNFNWENFMCMVFSSLLSCLLVAKENIPPRHGKIR